MVTQTNPWADTANQAIGAMYKHYMSQPNQGQLQQQDLRNQLLQAQLEGQRATTGKTNISSQLDERRLNAANSIADVVGGFYAPQTNEGARVDPSQIGPMAAVQSAPTQEMINERITQGRGDLMREAANFSIASPGSFSDVLSGFYGGAGAPEAMLAPMQDQGDLSAPVKNYQFRQTLGDDTDVFDAYVRANQKLNLGDQQVLASGATGLPVQTYGQGIAPDTMVDLKGQQIITTPGVAMGNRPVNGQSGAQAVQQIAAGAGLDPMAASQAAIQGQQADIGANPYQTDELTPNTGVTQPDGTTITPLPESPLIQQKNVEKERLQGIQSDLMNDEINRAIAGADGSVTGIGGALTKWVPGSGAHDFGQVLETIKGNIGFDKLQSMRDASPTGGALGQVSTFELETLQAVFGSLQQSQSAGQLRYNLMRMQNVYNDLIHGQGEGPERNQIPSVNSISAMSTPEELEAVIQFFDDSPPDDIENAIVQRANQLEL